MKKAISLLFLFLLVFCAACNSGPVDPPNGGPTEDDSPAVEGKWVVKEGASDYAVLIPDSASPTTQIAASEFQYFFHRATGIQLQLKTNGEYAAEGKYISFGDTRAAETVSVSQAELGLQGFKIVTVGDDIVVKSVGQHGLLWGAYELLTRMFRYEYYAKDVYRIDTDVKEYPLKDYDISDKPDITVRAVADSQGYTNSEVAHRLRQFQVYDEFLIPIENAVHNSFYYVKDGLDKNGKPIVDPKFLATCRTQLCLTGGGNAEILEEMLNRSLDYLKEAISKSDKSDVIFGVMDETGWCSCDACREVIERYGGAKQATMILYMNKLRDKLDAYLAEANIGREINLYFTAYFDITQPPVTKAANGEYVATDPAMVCKDGVGILFAPIAANYTQSIYSQTNETTYEQLKSFKAVTKKLLLWTYACNFSDFFAPYDSYTYMPDLFRAIVDNNGFYLFNQGRHSQGNSSQFDVLRQYLVAKLGWDVDADVGKLTDEFFEVYFGKAKEPMRTMYDELRTVMRYNYDVLGMSSGIQADVTNEKYWPEQLLSHWMELIDRAYALAGDDEALHDRILRESIFVRFYQLKFYIPEGDDVEDLKAQFISDAMKVGIEKASEKKAITQAFD